MKMMELKPISPNVKRERRGPRLTDAPRNDTLIFQDYIATNEVCRKKPRGLPKEQNSQASGFPDEDCKRMRLWRTPRRGLPKVQRVRLGAARQSLRQKDRVWGLIGYGPALCARRDVRLFSVSRNPWGFWLFCLPRKEKGDCKTMSMDQLAGLVSKVSDIVWNSVLLYLLVGTGVIFTIRTRFV